MIGKKFCYIDSQKETFTTLWPEVAGSSHGNSISGKLGVRLRMSNPPLTFGVRGALCVGKHFLLITLERKLDEEEVLTFYELNNYLFSCRIGKCNYFDSYKDNLQHLHGA